MVIVLVAVGEIDRQILEELKEPLGRIFNKQVAIGKDFSEPDYAFNKERNQWLSSVILDKIAKSKEYLSFERVLALVPRQR